MRSDVGKDDIYSNGFSKSDHIKSLLISKNTFCGSVNINEIKDKKLELELHFLASNFLA